MLSLWDLVQAACAQCLTTIAQHYEELGREAARDGLGHVEYLRRLAEAEAAARYERSVQRRTKAARLPVLKTLEQFDWSRPKKINRAQVQDLFRLRFIEQNSNAVFIGGGGLGYLPMDKRGADLLFQVISARYERSATVITANTVYKNGPASSTMMRLSPPPSSIGSSITAKPSSSKATATEPKTGPEAL